MHRSQSSGALLAVLLIPSPSEVARQLPRGSSSAMVLLARPGALAAQPAQAGPLGGSGQRSSGVFAGAPLAASRKSRCRRAAWDRQAHQPSATLTTPPPAAATAAPVARQRSSSPTRRERRQKGSAREEALVRLYTLYTDDAEFHAWSDGAIALYRRTSTGPVLAIRGAATLPWFLARQECTCDESAPGRCVPRHSCPTGRKSLGPPSSARAALYNRIFASPQARPEVGGGSRDGDLHDGVCGAPARVGKGACLRP